MPTFLKMRESAQCFLVITSLLAFACSTGRTLEGDRDDNTFSSAGSPASLRSRTETDGVVSSLADAAISTPGYYSKTAIRGTITRVNKKDQIGSPCVQCGFILKCENPTTKEIEDTARGQSDNSGNFSAVVKPNQTCRIEPSSSRYKVRETSGDQLRTGRHTNVFFEH